MKLILNNIRGFAGRNVINFRPLTILIGENSSGKTTILSSLAAVLSAKGDLFEISFNKPPFEMGGFDSIATYRGGKFGRAELFSIGLDLERSKGSLNYKYINHKGSPRLASISVNAPRQSSIDIDLITGKCVISSPEDGSGKRWKKEFLLENSESSLLSARNIISLLLRGINSPDSKGGGDANMLMEVIYNLLFTTTGEIPSYVALAPLRSKPRRTYDELIEEVKPEGDHIPLVLARAIRDKDSQGNYIVSHLTEFGNNSGLFEKINVKRMGKAESDPFQIRVKLHGPDANLTDVGYGVSQALPIVIDSLSARKGSVVLVQQPEVHLHPRAQAELGDFFANQVATDEKSFVVETHSDYLIDRVRMAVAEGRLKSEQVQLVYLQRKKLDIEVHHLSLNNKGDIVDPPVGYRSFFLEEEYKLMTRGA